MTISFVSQDSILPASSGNTVFTIPTLTSGQLMIFMIDNGSEIGTPTGWTLQNVSASWLVFTKIYDSSDAGTQIIIYSPPVPPQGSFLAGFSVYESSINNLAIGDIVGIDSSSTSPLQALTSEDVLIAASYNLSVTGPPNFASPYVERNSSGSSASAQSWIGFGDTIGTALSLTTTTTLNAGTIPGSTNFAMLIREASPPNAPSLTSPGNGSYIDATTNPSFTANNNSTDSANINARAMRLKASGATSYNYYNVSTGAFQSTIIWNAVNLAPGVAGTFGPISGLSNGITDNWSMADQEALANFQGPFASDFTVNMQAGPSLSINAPAGSVTTSNAPSLSYNASPASGVIDRIPNNC